ncbi:MAG: M48 family metallopeptidase [Thermodesulfobacteriota bacterium]
MVVRSRIPLLAAVAVAAALLLASGCRYKYAKLDKIDANASRANAAVLQQMALQEYLDHRRRINRLAWPLLEANAPLCRSRTHRLGLWATSVEELPFARRGAFTELFGRDTRYIVVDVFPGSPADKAGIKPGDILLEINGDKVRTGFDATSLFQHLLAKHLARGPGLEITVERDAKPVTLQATAVLACGPNVYLEVDDTPNAFADGVHITMTTGLIRLLADDDELAGVLGHELAHNEMGHLNAKLANAQIAAGIASMPGYFFDFYNHLQISGIAYRMALHAHSIDFEYEADYVGLYYAARAGYDITKVPESERKLAIESPDQITRGTTHPPSAERFLAMEAAMQEIQAKQAAGEPLVPNMKQ